MMVHFLISLCYLFLLTFNHQLKQINMSVDHRKLNQPTLNYMATMQSQNVLPATKESFPVNSSSGPIQMERNL